MKWTPIQTEALKELCMAGVSNAAIAEHFGVPVNEIHAKRSALGITIPKIKAMQGKPAFTVNPEFEAAMQEAERGLPKPLETFTNAGDTCIVLARRGLTALIVRTNVCCSQFVVPLQHIPGEPDWWQGRYFSTLEKAFAYYMKEIRQYAS